MAELPAKRLLENLAIGAGLPPPRLFVIDSPIPNAFAAGLDPARSVVAVTQGLLELLDRRELEGVLAHELSHIGNQDTRLNTFLAAAALILRMPDLRPSHAAFPTSPVSSDSLMWRYRVCAILACPVFLYVFLIAPALLAVLRSAISRSREFLADADAALLTRYPEGLLRALAKIQGAGAEITRSNPAFSHLFFADPSASGIGLGLFTGRLLASHPPLPDRIQRLAEFGGGVAPSVIEKAVQAGSEFRRTRMGAEGSPTDASAAPAQPAIVPGLTGHHMGMAAGFAVAVFFAMFLLLMKFAAK
jgi:heat shock protein HtpX